MAQMVLKMTLVCPWTGRDFEGVNAARKIIAEAVADIGKAMNVEVEYQESVTSVRGKGAQP